MRGVCIGSQAVVAGIVAFNNVIDGFMASCDTFTRAGGCSYPAEVCCCDSASGQFGGVEKGAHCATGWRSGLCRSWVFIRL